MGILQDRSTEQRPPPIEVERFFGGRARLFRVNNYVDQRGTLVSFEFSSLPFTPCRVFIVHSVPAGTSRGGHAHMRGEQLLIRVSGEVLVDLCCDGEEQRISLTESTQALLIGPCVWGRQTYTTPEATLFVLASEPYGEDS